MRPCQWKAISIINKKSKSAFAFYFLHKDIHFSLSFRFLPPSLSRTPLSYPPHLLYTAFPSPFFLLMYPFVDELFSRKSPQKPRGDKIGIYVYVYMYSFLL